MQAAQLWSRAMAPQIFTRVIERFKEEGVQVQIAAPKQPEASVP
jgi:hypothetical protein